MSVIKRIINTASTYPPVGPYSQAVLADRTLYVSGCLGINKDTMKLVDGGAEAEARQALINLGAILKAAGSDYTKVVKTTIMLGDIQSFPKVNTVYQEFFTKDFPARSTYQVGKLPLGAAVEIEAIALTGDVKVESS
ncbi:reactive intermediate imine deaminase A homolog UK114 [Arctopsyche grandis]|uniref:reactive intermediate imine deaminase A homolog UK114 n=1 Tax=Arctopsyche grandis TaxID=121162 RepID=UPI00406D9D3F